MSRIEEKLSELAKAEEAMRVARGWVEKANEELVRAVIEETNEHLVGQLLMPNKSRIRRYFGNK